MGKIRLGILDGVSGKVGNVVGASWKGIDYIRAKATHRNDPHTEKQMQQRARFKGLSNFAKPLMDTIIRPIWNLQAGKMTGMNLFTKHNMSAFGTSGKIVDFSSLKLSVGNLDNPYRINIAKHESIDSCIRISWEELTDKDYGGESLLLVAIDQEGSLFTELRGDLLRSEGVAEIDLPFDVGSSVHVYVFFVDSERRSYSDSQYFTVSL